MKFFLMKFFWYGTLYMYLLALLPFYISVLFFVVIWNGGKFILCVYCLALKIAN